MAKDYFQDIVPPGSDRARGAPERAVKLNVKETAPEPEHEEMHDDIAEEVGLAPQPGVRSIRNIAPSRTRGRLGDIREMPPVPPSARPRRSRWWVWLIALFGVIVLALMGIFAFRDTVITVIPRSHTVAFDQTARFTAYPEATAASGTLPYRVITADYEDSETLQTQGSQHVETKASGSITVFNSYSADPVKLVKNTRFSTPNGLIFRAPADITVPGKRGTTPGQVSVTVVADAAGEQYNVAATDKFTLPGLKSNPDMYSGVYAKSSAAMTGGFAGDQPAAEPGALEAARAAIRTRLQSSAAEAVQQPDMIAFPEISRITFQSLPSVSESANTTRIRERAHVEIVAFPKAAFAQLVAQSVSADAQDSSVELVPGANYAARLESATSSNWGADPINFTMAGQAQLVWNVDGQALAQALAGRDESAFQTVVTGFSGIQEAHARIEPFWKSSFPTEVSKIQVTVETPASPQ